MGDSSYEEVGGTRSVSFFPDIHDKGNKSSQSLGYDKSSMTVGVSKSGVKLGEYGELDISKAETNNSKLGYVLDHLDELKKKLEGSNKELLKSKQKLERILNSVAPKGASTESSFNEEDHENMVKRKLELQADVQMKDKWIEKVMNVMSRLKGENSALQSRLFNLSTDMAMGNEVKNKYAEIKRKRKKLLTEKKGLEKVYNRLDTSLEAMKAHDNKRDIDYLRNQIHQLHEELGNAKSERRKARQALTILEKKNRVHNKLLVCAKHEIESLRAFALVSRPVSPRGGIIEEGDEVNRTRDMDMPDEVQEERDDAEDRCVEIVFDRMVEMQEELKDAPGTREELQGRLQDQKKTISNLTETLMAMEKVQREVTKKHNSAVHAKDTQIAELMKNVKAAQEFVNRENRVRQRARERKERLEKLRIAEEKAQRRKAKSVSPDPQKRHEKKRKVYTVKSRPDPPAKTKVSIAEPPANPDTLPFEAAIEREVVIDKEAIQEGTVDLDDLDDDQLMEVSSQLAGTPPPESDDEELIDWIEVFVKTLENIAAALELPTAVERQSCLEYLGQVIGFVVGDEVEHFKFKTIMASSATLYQVLVSSCDMARDMIMAKDEGLVSDARRKKDALKEYAQTAEPVIKANETGPQKGRMVKRLQLYVEGLDALFENIIEEDEEENEEEPTPVGMSESAAKETFFLTGAEVEMATHTVEVGAGGTNSEPAADVEMPEDLLGDSVDLSPSAEFEIMQQNNDEYEKGKLEGSDNAVEANDPTQATMEQVEPESARTEGDRSAANIENPEQAHADGYVVGGEVEVLQDENWLRGVAKKVAENAIVVHMIEGRDEDATDIYYKDGGRIRLCANNQSVESASQGRSDGADETSRNDKRRPSHLRNLTVSGPGTAPEDLIAELALHEDTTVEHGGENEENVSATGYSTGGDNEKFNNDPAGDNGPVSEQFVPIDSAGQSESNHGDDGNVADNENLDNFEASNGIVEEKEPLNEDNIEVSKEVVEEEPVVMPESGESIGRTSDRGRNSEFTSKTVVGEEENETSQPIGGMETVALTPNAHSRHMTGGDTEMLPDWSVGSEAGGVGASMTSVRSQENVAKEDENENTYADNTYADNGSDHGDAMPDSDDDDNAIGYKSPLYSMAQSASLSEHRGGEDECQGEPIQSSSRDISNVERIMEVSNSEDVVDMGGKGSSHGTAEDGNYQGNGIDGESEAVSTGHRDEKEDNGGYGEDGESVQKSASEAAAEKNNRDDAGDDQADPVEDVIEDDFDDDFEDDDGVDLLD